MNKKSCLLASLAAFIIIAALESLFHGICLGGLYKATASLWRPVPEMTELLPYGYLIYAVTALLFTYIYIKGYEGKGPGLREGLRFGLIVGLFVSIPMAGWSYIIMPIPGKLGFYWFIMGMIEFLLAGAAVGLIYKEKKI